MWNKNCIYPQILLQYSSSGNSHNSNLDIFIFRLNLEVAVLQNSKLYTCTHPDFNNGSVMMRVTRHLPQSWYDIQVTGDSGWHRVTRQTKEHLLASIVRQRGKGGGFSGGKKLEHISNNNLSGNKFCLSLVNSHFTIFYYSEGLIKYKATAISNCNYLLNYSNTPPARTFNRSVLQDEIQDSILTVFCQMDCGLVYCPLQCGI